KAIDVGPVARCETRRVRAVLKIDSVGRTAIGLTETPLLARINDVDPADHRARGVREAGAETRDQTAALQHSECAIRGCGGCETVSVARVAAAGPRGVSGVRVSARFAEGPAGRNCTGCRCARKSVEVLSVCKARGGQADALCGCNSGEKDKYGR